MIVKSMIKDAINGTFVIWFREKAGVIIQLHAIRICLPTLIPVAVIVYIALCRSGRPMSAEVITVMITITCGVLTT
jgi:hypothetical protein